jgi:hypothetical protein
MSSHHSPSTTTHKYNTHRPIANILTGQTVWLGSGVSIAVGTQSASSASNSYFAGQVMGCLID